MDVINNMIDDFVPRLQTVVNTAGECLNQSKSILKEFRTSVVAGRNEVARIARYRAAVAQFCTSSAMFFRNPVQYPMDCRVGQEDADQDALDRSFGMSSLICSQLPEELTKTTGLPLAYREMRVPTVPVVWRS